MDKHTIKSLLKKNKKLLKDFGVRKIGLFGSYLRHQETDESGVNPSEIAEKLNIARSSVFRISAENALILKPASMTFQQAAATPQAAVVALQGLRDKGKIKSGQKVLINGSSGGVGHFAVHCFCQIF